MEESPATSSIARRLASCDKKIRDRALRSLNKWLVSHPDVGDEELRWIWKGIFYCMWHSDKQQPQLELITRLSSLLLTLDLPMAMRYFGVFLSTIRREWSGIDFLRLDKFYLMIRRFLYHFFLLLKKNSWNLEVCNKMMEILAEKTLLAVDKYPAQGVNYHVSEIFLEEVKVFLPLGAETVDVLLNPFFSVVEKTPDKVLLNKIKSNMFNCFLENGRKLLERKHAGDCVDSVDEVEKFGTIALTMGFAKRFFDLASSSDTLQGNRKFLYGLHEGFLMLGKDWEKSGVTISKPRVDLENEAKDLAPDTRNECGPEVPLQHVEVSMENGNCLDAKHIKKSKKAKKASQKTGKKSKAKQNGLSVIVMEDQPDDDKQHNANAVNSNEDLSNAENSNEDLSNAENSIALNESVISNLQKQFEKVAAEAGMEMDDTLLGSMPTRLVNGGISKKRKRVKSKDPLTPGLENNAIAVGNEIGKSGEKSAKKVRFAMKNNLVWKPYSPLPPQSLRLPPSATPRGSALKKGIPPGPIRESPALRKKVKQKGNLLKKGRKSIKSVSPAIKRLRRLQTYSE